MIRIIIVILLIFNSLACEPISTVSNNRDIQQQLPFICITSQSQCEVNSHYGRFNILFSQIAQDGKIKTELPFYIQLSFTALTENKLGEKSLEATGKINKIASYLEGKTMFMGKIPVFFQETNTNALVAESLLASCSEEIMTWRLWFTVEILVDGKIQQQGFFIDFDSQRLA